MSAVKPNGTCIRCTEYFGTGQYCRWCGVHRDRIVRYIRRYKIGGKRGRNSGTVKTSKNK